MAEAVGCIPLSPCRRSFWILIFFVHCDLLFGFFSLRLLPFLHQKIFALWGFCFDTFSINLWVFCLGRQPVCAVLHQAATHEAKQYTYCTPVKCGLPLCTVCNLTFLTCPSANRECSILSCSDTCSISRFTLRCIVCSVQCEHNGMQSFDSRVCALTQSGFQLAKDATPRPLN